MDLYHGTDEQTISILQAGNIKVDAGGGELGRGFYCGDLLWRAKAWAMQMHKSRQVLKVDVNDNDFLSFNPIVLVKSDATEIRERIKALGQTKTYLFLTDAVWSPVVGIPTTDFNQVKWESHKMEVYLNRASVKRSVI